MTCDARDQKLLLLAHNQLTPMARLATLAHVRNCAKCSARQARLGAVSQQIAGSLRPSGLAPWQPAPPSGLLGTLSLSMKLMLLTALLMIALTSAIVVTNIERARGHQAPAPGTFGPCRPDLPNDKCQ